MLRSIFPPETHLNTLMQRSCWDEVKQRLHMFPMDAYPTHSAQRGISPTCLSFALRSGAAVDVLEAMIQACPELISMRHYRNGNILHDAIKYKCSTDTVLFLLSEILKFENENRWNHRGELKPIHIQCGSESPRSTMVMNPEITVTSSSGIHMTDTLFSQTDEMGRTPLHCLMYRSINGYDENIKNELIVITSKLVTAFPPAVGKKDLDGLTPLDVILTTPADLDFSQENEMEVEMRVFHLCEILLRAYPSAAWNPYNPVLSDISSCSGSYIRESREHAMNVTIPEAIGLRYEDQPSYIISRSRSILSNSVQGDIALNPVSRAILHGRHMSTIKSLTETSRTSDTSWQTGHLNDWNIYNTNDSESTSIKKCFMSILTKDFEVSLHLATTMRCPVNLLRYLISLAPAASIVPDRCNLTPVDWVWIRYMSDMIHRAEYSLQHPVMNFHHSKLKISSRRILSDNFITFNENVSENLFNFLKADFSDATLEPHKVHRYPSCKTEYEADFTSKMKDLLPVAALETAKHHSDLGILKDIASVKQWKQLHAACFIDSPRFLVLNAIKWHPHELRLQDSVGNLPLHYAAARSGYDKRLHIGVRSDTKQMSERSTVYDLVMLYQDATKKVNFNGQLPLHIAIKREKIDLKTATIIGKTNQSRTSPCSTHSSNGHHDDSVPIFLSKVNPDSLECKDGLTGLFPFMLAATEDNFTKASINTIYRLLIDCPSVIHHY